ncbi:MAG: aspartate/glutamate racemase family protein [Pseudomonadota bacterium]
MRILVINPNSTSAMTEDIAEAAKLAALSSTEIVPRNPETGPVSIQGPEDGEAALPGLMQVFDEAMAEATAFDAVIIACFDDTGLQELKLRSPVPVLGIGEAAFHAACLCGGKFSTVTTLPVSVPIIEANISSYGFDARSCGVRASNVPVLSIGRETARSIEEEAKTALAEDGCSTIVLGCAGMADLASSMSVELGAPVIDGVAAAVGLCEAVLRLKAP